MVALSLHKPPKGSDRYYQIRRTQAKIVRLQEFYSGELFEYYNRKNFIEMAERLTKEYFHKSKKLFVYREITRMYRMFLVLSPIIQRIDNNMKLDWGKSQLLSWVRSNCNMKRERFFFSVTEEERTRDLDLLLMNLRHLGIYDDPFVTELTELFRYYYATDGVKSRLANAIFDPIMFFRKNQGYCIRIGNRFARLEKNSEHPQSVDLRKQYAEFLNYKIKYEREKVNEKMLGRIDIFLNDSTINAFRNQIKMIVKSKTKPVFKTQLLETRVRAFVETAKHAKTGFYQILDLQKWLKDKTKKLSATHKEAKKIHWLLMDLWKEKKIDKMFLTKPNFFWDIKEMDEARFMDCFSPYREPY